MNRRDFIKQSAVTVGALNASSRPARTQAPTVKK